MKIAVLVWVAVLASAAPARAQEPEMAQATQFEQRLGAGARQARCYTLRECERHARDRSMHRGPHPNQRGPTL